MLHQNDYDKHYDKIEVPSVTPSSYKNNHPATLLFTSINKIIYFTYFLKYLNQTWNSFKTKISSV